MAPPGAQMIVTHSAVIFMGMNEDQECQWLHPVHKSKHNHFKIQKLLQSVLGVNMLKHGYYINVVKMEHPLTRHNTGLPQNIF